MGSHQGGAEQGDEGEPGQLRQCARWREQQATKQPAQTQPPHCDRVWGLGRQQGQSLPRSQFGMGKVAISTTKGARQWRKVEPEPGTPIPSLQPIDRPNESDGGQEAGMGPVRWVLIGIGAGIGAGAAIGCANPAGPTDGATEWARAHASEVCISQTEGGAGKLIPNAGPVPTGWTIRPISYCNPAE